MYALETKNLNYSYESGNQALFNVSLGIKKGKKTVVLGPNGAGKSTLFLHLNGVHKPESGEVLYEGQKISYDQKSLLSLRSSVCLVFQNPDDQIFAPTVEEDVAFGPLNLNLPKDEVEKRIEESLAAVGLEDMRQRLTSALSFGQKKRVALAGALAMEPQVLIMDEPTAGLDSHMVHELLELSEELNHDGKTIAISTHDVETAYEWADEVIVIDKGRHIFSGSPDALFEQPELLHPIGLTPPLMFLLNEQRHLRTKQPESPRPHSLAEAAASFFPLKEKKPGTLYVVCVDKMAPIEPIALKVKHENSGIYGAHAQAEAAKLQEAAASQAHAAQGNAPAMPQNAARSAPGPAQAEASKTKMHFHHRFHALEHALLQTSIGEDFVLYSDSTLCSLLQKKAEGFASRTGIKIPIVHMHSQKEGAC